MCGRTFPVRRVEPGHFTLDNTLEELAQYSPQAAKMRGNLIAKMRRMCPDGGLSHNPELKKMIATTVEIPLSSLIINSGRSPQFFEALLAVANGKTVPGFEKMCKEQEKNA